MKKNILEICLDIFAGAASRYLFYPLYGLITAYSIENNFTRWIKYIPKDLSQYAFFFHFLIEETMTAILVIALTGILLGLVVRESPFRHGIIAFLGTILFDVFFYKFVMNDFDLFYTNYSPVWIFILHPRWPL